MRATALATVDRLEVVVQAQGDLRNAAHPLLNGEFKTRIISHDRFHSGANMAQHKKPECTLQVVWYGMRRSTTVRPCVCWFSPLSPAPPSGLVPALAVGRPSLPRAQHGDNDGFGGRSCQLQVLLDQFMHYGPTHTHRFLRKHRGLGE